MLWIDKSVTVIILSQFFKIAKTLGFSSCLTFPTNPYQNLRCIITDIYIQSIHNVKLNTLNLLLCLFCSVNKIKSLSEDKHYASESNSSLCDTYDFFWKILCLLYISFVFPTALHLNFNGSSNIPQSFNCGFLLQNMSKFSFLLHFIH